MSTLEFNDALIGMQGNLKSFAFSYTRNYDDAADLTQETILNALKHRMKYTPQTNFNAWVFTIMRNLFINKYRRSVKSATIFDASKDLYLLNNLGAESQQDPMMHMLNLDLIKQMNRLEEEFRKPFRLFCDGFKYQEISDLLGIPIGTVKSRIFVARKKLMSYLTDYRYLV